MADVGPFQLAAAREDLQRRAQASGNQSCSGKASGFEAMKTKYPMKKPSVKSAEHSPSHLHAEFHAIIIESYLDLVARLGRALNPDHASRRAPHEPASRCIKSNS